MKKEDLRYYIAKINKMKLFTLPTLYDVFEVKTEREKKRTRDVLEKMVQRGYVSKKEGGVYMPSFKKDHVKEGVIGYEPPKKDFYIICGRFGIEPGFAHTVLKEAEKVAHIPEAEIPKRKDYRKQLVFTIDGEDAKDLDDAVYLEKEGENTRLYVHIADVSFYVRDKSLLDKEAYKRGTSIYLADRVVPMLPKVISNGICSLNPNEEKLVFTAEMLFNPNGDMIHYEFNAGIMNSVRRFTYKEVENILDYRKPVKEGDEKLLPILFEMEKLAQKLRAKRFKEGSIDFDIPEMKIICDAKSRPIEVRQAERLFANNLIEEFMLSANKSVAIYLEKQGLGLYRVHESPDPEKMAEFINTAKILGYDARGFKHPKDFQGFLEKVKGLPESYLLNMLMLRSMPQAYYHHENYGHFGLAFSHYTHFTSPIRRYPDLVVHRLLKMLLKIEKHEKGVLDPNFLADASRQSSKQERNAVDMERAMQKRKAIHFLKGKLGNDYSGIISGVTDFGIYVNLDNMGIEGLVPRNLLSGYDYEENFRTYRKGSKELKMGKPARIKVISLNLKKEIIDFLLIED